MPHDRSDRPARRLAPRGLAVLALVPTIGLLLATGAYADVSSVTGRAFGESVDVTVPLVGGHVTSGPTPSVTLPAAGSASPVTGNLASVSTAVLDTGVLTVSTQGTTGATGSVTSSADVANPRVGLGLGLTDVLAADAVHSTCTSNETGSTGSATVTDLRVLGVPVSVSSAPNSTVGVAGVGTLYVNEQTVTGSAPTSSITVNALRLHITAGAVGSGDVIVGQSVCGVDGSGIPTPSGTVGGVLLSGLVAVAFAGNQLWRRRRASER